MACRWIRITRSASARKDVESLSKTPRPLAFEYGISRHVLKLHHHFPRQNEQPVNVSVSFVTRDFIGRSRHATNRRGGTLPAAF